MRNIKLVLEYDGTHFCGWQTQEQNRRTVQGEIEKVLFLLLKTKCHLIGSGRTDSGVHAQAQVANFKVKTDMTSSQIVKALNSNLPDDISVGSADDVSENFHARYSAQGKVYRYTILNRPFRNALVRHYSYFLPRHLNLSLLRAEIGFLIGKKDFKSFQASDPSQLNRGKVRKKGTVRTIKNITIKRAKGFVYIEMEADGFLYKMVRNIVGTLLEVGTGIRPRGSIKKILKEKNRRYAGKTAPAQGLCLMEVKY